MTSTQFLLVFLVIGLLFLVQNLQCRLTMFDQEYMNIHDLSRKHVIELKLSPFNIDPKKEEKNVTLWIKSDKSIQLVYCDVYKKISTKAHYTNGDLETEWIVPIHLNDKNIMSLFFGRGVVCKIMTKNYVFPFVIFQGDLPNIKPVIFEPMFEDSITSKRYHIWIQAILVILTITSPILIFIIIYCFPSKSKYKH